MIDINKAKQKILDLAIRGKHTKQLKSDGNAADLLVEIQKEKEKLIKDKKLKNDKNVIRDDIDEPFEIPENWMWCRIESVVESIIAGGDKPKNMKKQKDEKYNIPVYSNGERNDGLFGFTDKPKVVPPAITVSARGTIGYTVFRDMPFVPIVRLITITSQYSELLKYISYYIKTNLVDSNGSTTQQITIPMLINMLIPIPPLVEQKKIVEKVEQLFDILDKIDEAQKKYQKDKEILKSKIIEAGIRGKLTKQLKSDGDASDLLDEIRKEKERLIKEGKIKRDKKETYIFKNPKDNLYYEKYQEDTEKCIDDELPFEIPENWVWCKLNTISYNVSSKNNQILSSEVNENGKVPVISQGKELIDGYTDKQEKSIKDVPVILFGDHTRCVKYIDFSFVVGADGVKLHKVILCDAKYIYYCMKLIAKRIVSNGYARHHYLLLNEFLPLPPLDEQERIVEVIEIILKVIN